MPVLFHRTISSLIITCICTLLLFSYACKDQSKAKRSAPQQGNTKESLIKANKQLLAFEEEQIEDYTKRYKWKMNSTESGLRYMVYEEGEGQKAAKDLLAVIEYEVSLLNGVMCYNSGESGPKSFVIGKAEVEKGLDEAILFMQVGDRAKFVIPSHLAFGLLGDGEKIPSKASLVYDVKLISLSDNQR